jgi:YjbR
MSYSWENGPVEIPKGIFERVSALCLALPEVTVRVDAPRIQARSTAHSFDIRRRSFCLLIALERANGTAIPQLVVRADPADREALLSVGHPFYSSRGGHDRVRALLTEDTDWDEIRELVTESYRILAPKKLSALLDC